MIEARRREGIGDSKPPVFGVRASVLRSIFGEDWQTVQIGVKPSHLTVDKVSIKTEVG